MNLLHYLIEFQGYFSHLHLNSDFQGHFHPRHHFSQLYDPQRYSMCQYYSQLQVVIF